MHSSDGAAIFIAIFSIFAIIINFLALVIHVVVPKLMKNPGFLVFLSILCQFVYLTHFTVAGVEPYT